MIRASQIHRLRLCPGSLKAEDGLPESSNAYSEAGTRIHKMLETSDCSTAKPDEMDLIKDLVRLKQTALEDILGECKKPFHVIREKEVYVYDEAGHKKIVGHPDEVILAEHPKHGWVALITDTKTGFLEVDSAEDNDQLRAYSLGIHELAGVDVVKVYAKIIQRFVKHNVVEYDQADLKLAHADVMGVVRDAEAPDAKRAPSQNACRYCRALGTSRCPETSQIVEQAADELVVPLTPEQMARRIELFGIAEKIIEKEKAEYKELLAKDAEAIPGYYLKPGNVLGKIFNAQATFEIVAPVFTAHYKETSPKDADDKALALFQSCVTVNKGKLEDAISDATGLKGMALDNECEQLLSTVIVKSQNAPSLSKMSKAMLKERGIA